jgi:hypothetical protein
MRARLAAGTGVAHLGLFTLEQPGLIKGPTLGPMGRRGTIVSLSVPLFRCNV